MVALWGEMCSPFVQFSRSSTQSILLFIKLEGKSRTNCNGQLLWSHWYGSKYVSKKGCEELVWLTGVSVTSSQSAHLSAPSLTFKCSFHLRGDEQDHSVVWDKDQNLKYDHRIQLNNKKSSIEEKPYILMLSKSLQMADSNLRDSSHKNENCHHLVTHKPVEISLLCWTQRKIFEKSVTKQFPRTICFPTFFKNIFFCAQDIYTVWHLVFYYFN